MIFILAITVVLFLIFFYYSLYFNHNYNENFIVESNAFEVPENPIETIWDKETTIYNKVFKEFSNSNIDKRVLVNDSVFNSVNTKFILQPDNITFFGIKNLTSEATLIFGLVLNHPKLQVLKPFNINVENTPSTSKMIYYSVLLNNLTSGSTRKIGLLGIGNFDGIKLIDIKITSIYLLDDLDAPLVSKNSLSLPETNNYMNNVVGVEPPVTDQYYRILNDLHLVGFNTDTSQEIIKPDFTITYSDINLLLPGENIYIKAENSIGVL